MEAQDTNKIGFVLCFIPS